MSANADEEKKLSKMVGSRTAVAVAKQISSVRVRGCLVHFPPSWLRGGTRFALTTTHGGVPIPVPRCRFPWCTGETENNGSRVAAAVFRKEFEYFLCVSFFYFCWFRAVYRNSSGIPGSGLCERRVWRALATAMERKRGSVRAEVKAPSLSRRWTDGVAKRFSSLRCTTFATFSHPQPIMASCLSFRQRRLNRWRWIHRVNGFHDGKLAQGRVPPDGGKTALLNQSRARLPYSRSPNSLSPACPARNTFRGTLRAVCFDA